MEAKEVDKDFSMKIKAGVKKKLDDIKICKRETYSEVVDRLIFDSQKVKEVLIQ